MLNAELNRLTDDEQMICKKKNKENVAKKKVIL